MHSARARACMFGRKALLFLMQRLVSALAMAAMLRFQFLDVGLFRGEQVGPQQGDDYHACEQQCAKAERLVPHAEQRHKPHAYHTENVHGEVDERAGASGIAVVLRKQDVGGIQAYQLHNLRHVALQNGWTTFTSMQCRYNLLYREDERSSRNASCKPAFACRRPQRNKAATNYEAEIACSLPQARI